MGLFYSRASQSLQIRHVEGEYEFIIRHRLFCRFMKFLWNGPSDSPELVPFMQDLLDDTMIFSPTPKTRRLPQRLVAKKVLRNGNTEIYAKYAATRNLMKASRAGTISQVQVATQISADRLQDFRAIHFGGKETSRPLDKSLNEVYLWHGTSYEAVAHIFSEDFRVGAKKHAFPAGYFGQGLYFAESCAKADEYAHEGRHQKGWYNMHHNVHVLEEGAPVCILLLCRVTLGRVKEVQCAGDYHETCGFPVHGHYDALIGDRGLHRREFIVYGETSVFPEFAILYERDFRKQAMPPAEMVKIRREAAMLKENLRKGEIAPHSAMARAQPSTVGCAGPCAAWCAAL